MLTVALYNQQTAQAATDIAYNRTLIQMKRALPKQTGVKVPGRGNSKGVTINNRHYIIGGLAQSGIEMNIPSCVIKKKDPYEIEWRMENVQNIQMFTPRDSFAVAANGNKIYIFGGCLLHNGESTNQLLELDVEKKELKRLETKGQKPPPMNSMRLVIDHASNQLISFGGVSGEIKIPLGLYRLKLSTLEWKFQSLTLECYQHGVWQHTCHLLPQPLDLCHNTKQSTKFHQEKIVGLDLGLPASQTNLSEEKIAKINIGEEQKFETEGGTVEAAPLKHEQKPTGPILLIVGGCSHPNHPYSEITQVDISTGTIVSQTFINPTTAHDSVIYKDEVYVFGGSDGMGVNEEITIVGKQLRTEKGFVGLGPVGLVQEEVIIIFGGINASTDPITFNNMLILYE